MVKNLQKKIRQNREKLIEQLKNIEPKPIVNPIPTLRQRMDAVENTAAITFVTLAEKGEVNDTTAARHTELFSPWVANTDYSVGDLRQYENILYRCVQPHRAEENMKPDNSFSLWSRTGNLHEEYRQWYRPVGAHNAYRKGDKVMHDNRKWISTVDSNVWQPGDYGWEEVTS